MVGDFRLTGGLPVAGAQALTPDLAFHWDKPIKPQVFFPTVAFPLSWKEMGANSAEEIELDNR